MAPGEGISGLLVAQLPDAVFEMAGRGEEYYSLTSHALEARRPDLIQSLSRDRSLISESRVHTILDVVRLVATEANPGITSRQIQSVKATVKRWPSPWP